MEFVCLDFFLFSFLTSDTFTTLFSSKIAELNLEALASQHELQAADQEPSNATEVAQQSNKRYHSPALNEGPDKWGVFLV